MKISIINNLSVAKYLSQVPYAASRALNDVAFEAKTSMEADIRSKLKTRTKMVSQAFAVDKSDKADLTATVRTKDDWHIDVIPQHYRGGTGADIGFERAMISRGVMSASSSAVPIKKISKAGYKKLLIATRRGSGSKSFIVPQGSTDARSQGMTPGVYTRLKTKAKPVVLFTREAKYRKRLDMMTITRKVVSRRYEQYFYKWLHASV